MLVVGHGDTGKHRDDDGDKGQGKADSFHENPAGMRV
jgi:hypothetical protein